MTFPNALEPEQRSPSLDREVSPRTRGLALFIQEAIRSLRRIPRENEADNTAHDGLLFLGHWHDASARLLFHDPVLEPVDKVVWAVIRQHAEVAAAAIFPSYQTIARLANIGSKATVARAIMILRITRWMSLCARVRDEKGRFQGNVYALHDEPVAVGDAMHLDPEYLQFLKEMQHHHHDQVKRVATVVLATIEAAIEAGSEVIQETMRHPQHEQRLASLGGLEEHPDPKGADRFPDRQPQALDRSVEVPEGVAQGQAGADRVQHLNSANGVQKSNSADENRVQHLNSDIETLEKQQDNTHVQNLNSVSVGSSSYKTKTTTTTTTTPSVNPPAAHKPAPAWAEIHFPPQLSPNEIILAKTYLGRLPWGQRQDILDELQGRLGSAGHSGQPIRNPIGYLAQLCNAVRTEAFQLTSAGLHARQAREHAAQLANAEAKEERRYRQELLAEPPLASPLVNRIMAIRQQAQVRQRESRSSGSTEEASP